MASGSRRLLVIQAAGLGYDLIARERGTRCGDLVFRPMESAFPSVTCTVQASFRTGLTASAHGMVGNGFMYRELARPLFWEQSAALVWGPRIWDDYRARGKRVAMLFWQQSLGEAADQILSPAPIHRHGGGMIQSCYSQPASLYDHLCAEVGSTFNLMRYWGPWASAKSSDWIAAATAALVRDPKEAPDLCLTYLPALDYDLQRYGPAGRKCRDVLDALLLEVTGLATVARDHGYDVLIFGDYAIVPVGQGPVFPNIRLREAGLFEFREVRGMWYPDFHRSRAFAVADHEIAHVYCRAPADAAAVRDAFAGMSGVGEVLDATGQGRMGIRHSRSGDLILVAADGFWFDYRWWDDAHAAPDYARHVDIHHKPGYDPGELFFGWPPGTVSMNPKRVRGTHGRVGSGRAAAWAATWEPEGDIGTLFDLSAAVKRRLE